MDQYKVMHETVVRDIVDLLNDLKDMDEVDWFKNRHGNVGSIAKRASGLVLTFPVLVSTSISIQSANIIAKAIERKCVALLQILFAAVNYSKSSNLYDYIGQFHKNISNGLSLDEFIDILDKLSESGEIEVIDRDTYEAVKEDLKNINYHLTDILNENTINDYACHYSTTNEGDLEVVVEAIRDRIATAKDVEAINDRLDSDIDTIIDKVDGVDSKLSGINSKLDRNRRATSKNINQHYNASIKANKANTDKMLARMDTLERNVKNAKKTMDVADKVDYYRHQLLPQEVTKSNELVPTIMTVAFSFTDDEGNVHNQTGIIGVKAKMYPVDNMEIINRFASKYTDSNSLFKLIKASTREISFFRDFVFAVDKANLDAINMSKKSANSRIFKLLERRASQNKVFSLMKRNDASPITSVVISAIDAEYLQKYNNIDMEKPRTCKTIMQSYNLLDIVIVDESLEVAKFMYDDGEGAFETYTFDSLEKEAKDSSYKKVLNLLSKVNR